MTKTKTSKYLSEDVFWQYSGKLYSQPGVKESCLILQDEVGLNVNLILLLCWCEPNHKVLSEAQIEQLGNAIVGWHKSYIAPLRDFRRQLGLEHAATAQVKQKMLDAELELEKVEQSLLLDAFNELELQTTHEAQCLQLYIPDTRAVSTFRLGGCRLALS
ncbi:MAG: hypothetical protein ACI9FJ_000528 [Alteromonadaceae bacterium]|jgi:uncharacterized protein (TIGR02444 family)